MLTIGIVTDAQAGRHSNDLAELGEIGVRAIECKPSELDALLQRGEVNAVYIGDAIQAAFELGTRTAKAGKHVIAPWPVTRTLDELCALESECQRASVMLIPVTSSEQADLIRALKKALVSGTLGNPVALRLVWVDSKEKDATRTPEDELFVRIGRALYLAQQVFGRRAEQVYGQRAHTSDPAAGSQYAQLMLRYAAGETAVLEVGTGHAPTSYRMLMLLGTQGAAYLNHPEVGMLIASQGSNLVNLPGRRDRLEQWRAIVQRVQGREVHDTALDDLKDCLAATQGAAESFERGEPVSLAGFAYQGEMN